MRNYLLHYKFFIILVFWIQSPDFKTSQAAQFKSKFPFLPSLKSTKSTFEWSDRYGGGVALWSTVRAPRPVWVRLRHRPAAAALRSADMSVSHGDGFPSRSLQTKISKKLALKVARWLRYILPPPPVEKRQVTFSPAEEKYKHSRRLLSFCFNVHGRSSPDLDVVLVL